MQENAPKVSPNKWLSEITEIIGLRFCVRVLSYLLKLWVIKNLAYMRLITLETKNFWREILFAYYLVCTTDFAS